MRSLRCKTKAGCWLCGIHPHGSAAAAAGPGGCRVGEGEQKIEGFTLRGLMAAAEMDSKV